MMNSNSKIINRSKKKRSKKNVNVIFRTKICPLILLLLFLYLFLHERSAHYVYFILYLHCAVNPIRTATILKKLRLSIDLNVLDTHTAFSHTLKFFIHTIFVIYLSAIRIFKIQNNCIEIEQIARYRFDNLFMKKRKKHIKYGM